MLRSWIPILWESINLLSFITIAAVPKRYLFMPSFLERIAHTSTVFTSFLFSHGPTLRLIATNQWLLREEFIFFRDENSER